MLTVQMLVRDNEKTVERTINSLPKGVGLVVGDIGSTDSTPEVCRRLGAEVVRIDLAGDYSRARNSLIRDGVNMYLEPWEFLVSGGDLLSSMKGNTSFYVVESGVVTKQTRLWVGEKFQNPVFETIAANSECDPRVVMGSSGGPDTRREKLALCEKWLKKKPTSPEPYYYLSFSFLSLGMIKEFRSAAGNYLAMRDDCETSTVMLKYNLARVEFLSGEMASAARRVLECISARPSFSEFWCLLGDMLYKQGKYERAKAMYQNAMTIGKRRLKTDDGPIDIRKYGTYPSFMMENIDNMRSETKLFIQKGP